MVQAYKVELSEVNDWMQETRTNIEQQVRWLNRRQLVRRIV